MKYEKYSCSQFPMQVPHAPGFEHGDLREIELQSVLCAAFARNC